MNTKFPFGQRGTSRNNCKKLRRYIKSINYVVSKSAIFDPLSPLSSFLLGKVYVVNRLWGYPLPPLRRHSLWTAPNVSRQVDRGNKLIEIEKMFAFCKLISATWNFQNFNFWSQLLTFEVNFDNKNLIWAFRNDIRKSKKIKKSVLHFLEFYSNFVGPVLHQFPKCRKNYL